MKKTAKIISIVLSLCLIVSLYMPINALAEGSVDVTYPITYGQTEARSMLSEINAFRISDTWYWNEDNNTKTTVSGLTGLTYDYGLEKVAMKRAAEIALYYGHTRPDGSDCFTAYDFTSGSAAENIAAGQSSAHSVFVAWREDKDNYSGQGHRRNMLKSSMNYIGIGHVVCNGIHYWVQEFSRKPSGATETNPDNSQMNYTTNLLSNYIYDSGIRLSTYDIELDRGDQASIPVATTYIRTTDSWHKSYAQTPIIPAEAVTWSVNDASIAELSDGKIFGKQSGIATLTASLQLLGKNVSDTCSIMVRYIVDFSMNDNGGYYKSDSVLPNDYAENPGIPIREGYTFIGWYEDSDCTKQVSFPVIITADTTFYAGWTKNHNNASETTVAHIHQWDNGKITKKATPVATGVKTYTCTSCGATKTETISKCEKYKNTLKVSLKKSGIKTIKYSKLKKSKQAFKVTDVISVSKAKGKVTYKKISGNKYISVSKTGKVSVKKKGLKKGKTYSIKVKVTAAGNSSYKSNSITKTIKIKVK